MFADTHNVTLESPDQEYSFSVPGNCKYLLVKTRNGYAPLKMAYIAGKSGTEYITIAPTSVKTIVGSDNQTLSEIVLYFQSSISDVVEIETWQ